jgi:hypothetical protein
MGSAPRALHTQLALPMLADATAAAPLRLAGRARPALVHLVQAIVEPPFPSCPCASGYRNPRCLLSAQPSVIEDFRRHSVSPPSPASRFNGARQWPSSMCALPIEHVPRHLLSAAQLMPPSSGHLVDGSSPAPFSCRRCRLVSVSQSAKAYPSPFQYRDASLITHWSCWNSETRSSSSPPTTPTAPPQGIGECHPSPPPPSPDGSWSSKACPTCAP